MTGEEFDALEIGATVWMRTGHFTASRVRVRDKDGAGATRRAWVDVLDRAPSQEPTGEINSGRALPVSYKSLERVIREDFTLWVAIRPEDEHDIANAEGVARTQALRQARGEI